MSELNKIIQAFKNLGYCQTSELLEQQINKALDRLFVLSGGQSQFDRDVAEHIWEHTSKEKGNKVLLRQYVKTILNAQNALKQHIENTEKKLKLQNNPAYKSQLQADLHSYVNDLKMVTQPFNFPHVPNS